MKNKNPNSGIQPVSCYKPKMKDLKVKLKSANEAKGMIEDLHTNDYLPYNMSTEIRGNIRLLIEDIEKQIVDVKDTK